MSGERYLTSRASFSAQASRMNAARPYVPTRASICSSMSGGNRTGVGFPMAGRPIGRTVVEGVAAGKKTMSFSLDAINDADYINGIVYGGKSVATDEAEEWALVRFSSATDEYTPVRIVRRGKRFTFVESALGETRFTTRGLWDGFSTRDAANAEVEKMRESARDYFAARRRSA